MELYSTKQNLQDPSLPKVNFEEAVFNSLPEDNGLYMPVEIPKLPKKFFDEIEQLSFQEIAYEVARNLIKGEIPEESLKKIVDDAINFDAPLVKLNEQIHVLELFHGPTLAFKDFGARFMARVMSWFLENNPARAQKGEVHILVATSGDTGGAVAQGFLNVPNIRVTLLYPKGQVSEIQEKQLTTVGNNVEALEVDGTFDDCQKLVKSAFLDTSINRRLNLSSANSINISRLIPQSFYFFHAYAQLKRNALEKGEKPDEQLIFSVPSGNFGNLCGGMLAKKMGLPTSHMIAATNINDIVPQYLETGKFNPRPSQRTLSNAMDVGNPSNFARLKAFYQQNGQQDASEAEWLSLIRKDITGKSFTDDATRKAILNVYRQYNYLMDPHGAVGYLGLEAYLQEKDLNKPVNGIILETAHPAKFMDIVTRVIGQDIPLPGQLANMMEKPKNARRINNHYEDFKNYLLNRVNQ